MARITDIEILEDGFLEKAELKAYALGIEHERKRIIQTIRDTYVGDRLEELGSLVRTEEIIQTIQGTATRTL